MSLAFLQIIYDGIRDFFGYDWIVWVMLAIAMLAVFSAILRVNFIITAAIAALPFLILGIYAVIQLSSWMMYAVFFLLGVILALSLWKLLTKS